MQYLLLIYEKESRFAKGYDPAEMAEYGAFGKEFAKALSTGKALQPVTISALFPAGFTHPHLVGDGPVSPRAPSLTAWPMQVTSPEDAELQRPVLWAIATAEVHDRIYQSSWQVISA